MTAALLGTHLLLAARGGRFLSVTDPPEWAAEAARDWPRTALRNSCQGAGLTYTQLLA